MQKNRSLAQWTALGEQEPVGVLIEDRARRVVYANAGLCAIFGISDAIAFLGSDFRQAADAVSKLFSRPEEFLRDIEARLAGGEPVVGERLTMADGRCLERDYIPARFSEEHSGHVWLYHDVTMREDVILAVRESETRYRSVIENQTEVISRWLPDGAVVFVNDAYCRFFGRRREDVLGKSFFTRLPAGEEQRMRAHVAGFSRENPTQTIEHRVELADGTTRWYQWANSALFDAAGNLTEIQSTGRDVTDRRQIETERVHQLGMFRSILESSPDGILVIDADGKVLTYNQRFVQIWNPPAGWDTDLLPAERRMTMARLTTDAPLFWRELNEVLTHPEMTNSHIIQTVAGRTIERSSTPYREGNAIVGRIWNYRDITAQQRQQETQLQSQKLEAVGLLAGGIAHDFNNALTIILGNVTLARQEVEGRGEASERLAMAESACLRARSLTQQLLTFSRGGAPIKRMLSLTPLLRDTITLALRGSGVICDSDFTADLWPVEADEGQIRQMWLSLMLNAKEAMLEGGKIEVCAQNTAPADPDADRWITLTLRDHGVGIAPDLMPRIFDPYFSTKSRGRGLGLPTAYSIVRDHGGQISIESQPGQGTTVTVRLPALQGAPQAVVSSGAAAPTRALRILIMDDEDFVREIAGRLLKRIGHSTTLAADGAEAIKLYVEAQAAGQPFDVTIMDIVVPDGMGGQEAAQRILAIDPKAKLIVSSGYSNDPIMADFRRYGFSSVAPKPYKMEELYHAVDECLQG